MSRSTGRSRGEKLKQPKVPVQVSAPPAQKPEVEDAILGRLTQAQLRDLVIREDAEEIVGEIMDELLTKVMKGCYAVYIKRQIAPFCAFWAKNYLIQTLRPQLLCTDEGDRPEEASKSEDPEPLPAISDAWAQGCVPVVPATPLSHPPLQQAADIVQFPAQTHAGVKQRRMAIEKTSSSPKQTETETSPGRPVTNKGCKVLSPRTPQVAPKIEKKKKQLFVLIPKPVPGKLLPSLSRSTKRKRVALEPKTGTNSVHTPKTGPFNPPKGHQPIPKIDFSSLPRQSIIPLYEIVDVNCTKSKKPSGLSKLDSKYNKQQTERKRTLREPLAGVKDQQTEFQRRNKVDVFLKKLSPSSHRKEGIVSSGSLRLDTMVLAKGVTLTDPEAAEMNPLRSKSPRQGTKLRPIQSVAFVPLLSADQITSGPPPQAVPLLPNK